MKLIELSEETYRTIVEHYGDVATLLDRMAREAIEVAAVQEGIDAYTAGDYQPVEETFADIRKRIQDEK